MSRLGKFKKRLRTVKPDLVELDIPELKSSVEKVRKNLSEEEYGKLCLALDTLGELGHELDKKRVSIERLKQMLFGETTEKIENVFKDKEQSPPKNENKPIPVEFATNTIHKSIVSFSLQP